MNVQRCRLHMAVSLKPFTSLLKCSLRPRLTLYVKQYLPSSHLKFSLQHLLPSDTFHVFVIVDLLPSGMFHEAWICICSVHGMPPKSRKGSKKKYCGGRGGERVNMSIIAMKCRNEQP